MRIRKPHLRELKRPIWRLCYPQVMACRFTRQVRTPGRAPARRSKQLLACVAAAFDLLHDLIQVEGFGSLQRRERLERLKVLQPQLLSGGQDAEVVHKSGRWGA